MNVPGVSEGSGRPADPAGMAGGRRLSLADEALVRRESGLPGLATLLDEAAFLAHLRVTQPHHDVRSARLRYLRFKSGTNCLAAYAVEVGDREHLLHAKAGRPGELVSSAGASAEPGGGLARTWSPALALACEPFPHDPKLPALRRFADPEYRRLYLLRHRSLRSIPPESELLPLHYKPGRRFVGCLARGSRRYAVLKLYTETEFPAAWSANRGVERVAGPGVTDLWRASERREALVFGWREGTPLMEHLTAPTPDVTALSGVAERLSNLHRCSGIRLRRNPADHLAVEAFATARLIAALLPYLGSAATETASVLVEALARGPSADAVIHGDFHGGQVLVNGRGVELLDFDAARRGHPVEDFASFAAHLEMEVLRGRITDATRAAAERRLLEVGPVCPRDQLDRWMAGYTALRLFGQLPEFFRRRDADWSERMELGLARVRRLVREGARSAGAVSLATCAGRGGGVGMRRRALIVGPVPMDASLPHLPLAMCPAYVEPRLRAVLRGVDGEAGTRWLAEVALLRHKPGRRALLGYSFPAARSVDGEALVVLGKLRGRRPEETAARVSGELRAKGWNGADGFGVPEPLGEIPELFLQLQRKVGGVLVAEALVSPGGPALAARCAGLVGALHRADLRVSRAHGLDEELELLLPRLARAGVDRPKLAARIGRIAEACSRLTGMSRPRRAVLLHRDFYHDQVLAEGDRLWLLDLDLCALGDPCLDHGNFIAHVMELGLRRPAEAGPLAAVALAYREAALAGSAGGHQGRLEAYSTLSLARHIDLSLRIAGREMVTEALVDLCEQRLAIPSRLGASLTAGACARVSRRKVILP